MNAQAARADRQLNAVDLLEALNVGKRLIVLGTLLLCVLVGGLTLLLPDKYQARAQLLPPKEQKQGFGFSDLLATLPIPSLRLGEKGTPADIFIAILMSPTTQRDMVETFDLMAVYEADVMDDALELLADHTAIEKSEQGTILVDVLDTDPQRAAAMANHYVALLDSTNRRLSRKDAEDRYRFILQLEGSETIKLEQAMERLQTFQAEHNAIAIEDQARAVIRAAAEMEMASAELEITRQSLLASGFAPSHPQVQKVEQEFLLRQQYLAFLRGGMPATEEFSARTRGIGRLELKESLFLPLQDFPQVAQEYANIEKDVLVQSALLKLLLEQKAESLIEASNTTSTVQILDHALPPDRPALPRRLLIVFIAGILGVFASTTYVVGRVYVLELRQQWRLRHEAPAR